MDTLEDRIGGKRTLGASDGRMNWPKQGLYLFFENGEHRTDSGTGMRVVRVGTHAVSEGSKTTLWNRLSQHKGVVKSGGGNHRGSIFRLIVGEALQRKDPLNTIPSWGKGSSAPKDIREKELPLECVVSEAIRSMPFLYVNVEGRSSKGNDRSVLEQNLIGLLSNHGRPSLDEASSGWLGNHCPRDLVLMSGLWNSQYVTQSYQSEFIELFESYVMKTS